MLCENIQRDAEGSLRFAGFPLRALAEKYGTPLYLMDEERLRQNCRMYVRAFREQFGEKGLVLYAGKANCFKQLLRLAAEEGLCLDAVSLGEIATALAAGFPREKIFFHGNGRTPADVRAAMEAGVGFFVADNLEELALIDREAERRGRRQQILLRVTPGIDPHTYAAVRTGQVDSKFGFSLETGQADKALALALSLEHLELRGLHCHVGSQVFDEDVFERTVDVMTAYMALVRQRFGWLPELLDLGGGYGVRYTEADKRADIPGRIAQVAARLRQRCEELELPLPTVLMEPGRSIVADAGMTVYSVCSVKRIPGYKSYVIVDGGMGDNPRYPLYGAAYTVLHAERTGPEAEFELAGRCCESGDVIQPHILLPEDVRAGELIAVCTTGAYNYSMASNYNRYPRPPVVMLSKEGDRLAVRRETPEDVICLDL